MVELCIFLGPCVIVKRSAEDKVASPKKLNAGRTAGKNAMSGYPAANTPTTSI